LWESTEGEIAEWSSKYPSAKPGVLPLVIADEILSSLTVEDPGWVRVAATLELVWVMVSKDRFDRKAITKTLNQLLLQQEFVVEQAESVQNALQLFRKGTADFADRLMASSARAAGCGRTVTFDRMAARDAGMKLLT
jgi:predicted nucleic-acid-binding protein